MHILISIDQSYMDEQLMNFTFSSTKLLEINEISLMHISSKDLYETVLHHGQQMTRKESIEQMILAKLYKVLGEDADTLPYNIIVKQGEPFSQILQYSKKNNTDLIVVGKKHIGAGTGEFSKKISRRAQCSVLTITENSSSSVQKVLVPIDFSKRSQKAMQEACEIAQKTDIEITALHIYALPVGYTSSGKSVSEYASILKKHATKRLETFLKPYRSEDVTISTRIHLDKNGGNAAKIIINTALVEDADLLLMGSRGKSNLAATFLGSNTEKILSQNMSIPTLVHKNATVKKSVGLLEALLQV